jgi:hypothetical protein
MSFRTMFARWSAVALLAIGMTGGLAGCGGGAIKEGSPPENTGYVEPTDGAVAPSTPAAPAAPAK